MKLFHRSARDQTEVPQGLKPDPFCGAYGTAKAVPLQDPIHLFMPAGTAKAVPLQDPIHLFVPAGTAKAVPFQNLVHRIGLHA